MESVPLFGTSAPPVFALGSTRSFRLVPAYLGSRRSDRMGKEPSSSQLLRHCKDHGYEDAIPGDD
jgi:hypothetical protein